VPRDEIDDPAHIAGGMSVNDRLIGQARAEKPGAGAAMQRGHDSRLGAGQFAAQHLGEKMVVAEPLARVVERHDEEIFPLEHVDDRGRAGRPVNGFAERGAEAAENRGPREELPDFGRLPAQDLLSQEVDDEPAVAGEMVDEGARRGMPAQRESSEVDRRWPPLGPVGQIGQLLRGELGIGDSGD
jgi:hypothetical protein